MDAAKAGAVTDGLVVDQAAGDGGVSAAKGDGEVGERSAAVDDVTTLFLAVLRAGDGVIISCDSVGRCEEESCACIGDGGSKASAASACDRVAVRVEHPETLAKVDRDVVDCAGVFRIILAEFSTNAQVDDERTIGANSQCSQSHSYQGPDA